MTTERDKGRQDERDAVLAWLKEQAECQKSEKIIYLSNGALRRAQASDEKLAHINEIREAITGGDHHQPKP